MRGAAARVARRWLLLGVTGVVLAETVASEANAGGLVATGIARTVGAGINTGLVRSPVRPPPVASPADVGTGSLLIKRDDGKFHFIPLEGTEVEIDVQGLVASTNVIQRFLNDSEQPVEAVYVFPLPHEAAVYEMEARIGSRLIKSVIKEKEEAKRTYEAAKAEGKRAALLEQERPNIFTTSLANLMPGDHVDVRIRVVEALQWDDGRVRLVFPTVVGPRFIPGNVATGHQGSGVSADTDVVNDASRITPPLLPENATEHHTISIEARVDLGAPLMEVLSPSHHILASRNRDGSTRISLDTAHVLPNKDFVMDLFPERSEKTRSALFVSSEPVGGERHFMMVAYPPTEQKQGERPPMEMLFLVDHSGSMSGKSMEQAREAVLYGLNRLRPGDRFNIVAYDDKFVSFRPWSVDADSSGLEAGRQFVNKLTADGGTMMLPALEYLMATPQDRKYLRYIVVLTDGDLGNEDQIFRALHEQLGEARLFTVAIGSAPNHFLATKMAEYGRGAFAHISDIGEIQREMAHLLDKIQSPALADLSLTWEGLTPEELLPNKLPDLYLGHPLVLFGRLAGGTTGSVEIRGRTGSAKHVERIPLDVRKASFHPAISTLWARKQVDARMNAWRNTYDENERGKLRGQVLDLALKHHLVTQFTSLVAVEEVVVNPGGEQASLAVPTELPDGWERDKVVGANPQGGTWDMFLELLGLCLLAAGCLMLVARRQLRVAA
ncbi:MAG: marine proteobacterial sortase target protein [Myxococcota bacterium]